MLQLMPLVHRGKPCCKKTLWSCQPRRDTMSARTNVWLRDCHSPHASCCLRNIVWNTCIWRSSFKLELISKQVPSWGLKANQESIRSLVNDCHIISFPRRKRRSHQIAECTVFSIINRYISSLPGWNMVESIGTPSLCLTAPRSLRDWGCGCSPRCAKSRSSAIPLRQTYHNKHQVNIKLIIWLHHIYIHLPSNYHERRHFMDESNGASRYCRSQCYRIPAARSLCKNRDHRLFTLFQQGILADTTASQPPRNTLELRYRFVMHALFFKSDLSLPIQGPCENSSCSEPEDEHSWIHMIL